MQANFSVCYAFIPFGPIHLGNGWEGIRTPGRTRTPNRSPLNFQSKGKCSKTKLQLAVRREDKRTNQIVCSSDNTALNGFRKRTREFQSAPIVRCNLAVVYAWNGQLDLAISALDQLTNRPAGSNLPGQPTYGDFKRNPLWDPLRGDSRFEKIVASLAPNAADK